MVAAAAASGFGTKTALDLITFQSWRLAYNRSDLTKRYRTVPDWIYYFLVLPLLALLPPGWGYRLVCRHARHFYRGQVEARELLAFRDPYL